MYDAVKHRPAVRYGGGHVNIRGAGRLGGLALGVPRQRHLGPGIGRGVAVDREELTGAARLGISPRVAANRDEHRSGGRRSTG